MGSKNISISEEAYQRLASLKKPNESFTQVINRLTQKRSILELAGTLSEQEAAEITENIKLLRRDSEKSLTRNIGKAEAS
ncbi:MAG: antitoxin VapB family protein [Deltaproteobacteria bacterium]|nr:antitoxin VapB family protein [Deltaproteobacteria bacterium]